MNTIIETKYGKIRGTETENGVVYKAIPYAKPPVGDRRFKAPEPPEKWDGVLYSEKFPPKAVQEQDDAGGFYKKEFYSNPEYEVPVSENCLYLNIWAPKQAQNCPVAIWYHGGGFMHGHGGELEFDGDAFAKRGVILVTVNYRLGILGFLCHESLRDENGVSGNWGIKDQIAAINWVRDNIASFGGDPELITIFGQSAGGMAVRDIICSPLVDGKIHRAIIQSGKGIRGPIQMDFQMEEMEQITGKFLQEKKIGLNDLYKMSEDECLKFQQEYNTFAGEYTHSFISITPVIDGFVIPENSDTMAENGKTLSIPLMVGSTKNDIGVSEDGVNDPKKSEMQKSLMRLAGAFTKHGANGYAYHFSRQLPGDDAGAFHSSELWYVFGTLGRCWRPMEKRDYDLAGKMTDIWASFIKTGDPGWQPCDGETGYYQELT
jgi:para-nitrobenzyl esterase